MKNSIKSIKIFKKDTKSKFVDAKQVTATKRAMLPAYIAGKHYLYKQYLYKQKFKQITKIHKQFDHASKEKIEEIP